MMSERDEAIDAISQEIEYLASTLSIGDEGRAAVLAYRRLIAFVALHALDELSHKRSQNMRDKLREVMSRHDDDRGDETMARKYAQPHDGGE